MSLLMSRDFLCNCVFFFFESWLRYTYMSLLLKTVSDSNMYSPERVYLSNVWTFLLSFVIFCNNLSAKI